MKRIDYIDRLNKVYFFGLNLKTINLEDLEFFITEMQNAVKYLEDFDDAMVESTMDDVKATITIDGNRTDALAVTVTEYDLFIRFPIFVIEYITLGKQIDVWTEWKAYSLKKKMKLLKQALSDRIEMAQKRIDFLNEEI